MKSIQALQSPLLLPLQTKLKQKQQLGTPNVVLWFSSNEPTGLTLHRQRFRYSAPTKALPNPIVLALTSPSKSTDLSAFLQISALLLFLYWISNFIVPDIISKYYKFDQADENQNLEDRIQEDKDAEPVPGSKTGSGRKRKGFNSTKT